MTEQEAIELCKNDPYTAAKIIIMVEKLQELVALQEIRIKELEARLNMNSKNSSKPPSTDNKLKKDKKKPTSSNNKRGAQKGHKGNTLKMSNTPDKIEHLIPTECHCCGKSLKKCESLKSEKRQLFDLPKIKMYITEYQAHTKECPHCHTLNKATFPPNIKSSTQYGDKLKSFVSYLNAYQMLPYERIAELIEDLSSHKISTGTIYNFLNSHYEQLENFENIIKKELINEEILHSDETGINIAKKLHWIHVASSSKLTYYMLHAKRGKIAIDDMEILPNFKGVVVHDHWKPYSKYTDCTHSYCNAHILRELQGVTQNDSVQWSQDMHTLLTNMNIAVHKAKDSNKECLSDAQIKKFTKIYEKIIKSALKLYPPPNPPAKKQKGRQKQPKAKNLLDRLSVYQVQTLRFLNDFRVPFTNNQAEKDLRMIKVKEKISGSFASFKGGEIFCRIRSYISTLKKNDLSVFKGLESALSGKLLLPVGVGG
jgi:transposase